MLREPRRLVSAALAIVLGIAFVTTTLLLGAAMSDAVSRNAAGSVGDASVVVTRPQGPKAATISAETVDAARRLPGVTGGDAEISTMIWQRLAGRTAPTSAQSVPTLSELTRLAQGRLPNRSGEAAVSSALASARHTALGQRIEVAGEPDWRHTALTVVGVVEPGVDTTDMPRSPIVFTTADQLMTITGQPGFTELRLYGGDPDRVADAARTLPQVDRDHLMVRTGAAEIDHRVDELTQGTAVLTGLLLAFGLIALFVACLVIANTFAILLAQRTRHLALLRCVGATRRQVLRLVLIDSLLLGVVGSIIGVVVGIGLAWLAIRLGGSATNIPLDRVVLTPVALGLPLLTGLLATVLAALPPARAATKVAPLAALRPQPTQSTTGRPGRLRLGTGVALVVLGSAALVAGAALPALLLGIAGGMLSCVGVLVIGPLLVPAVARVVGILPARVAPVTGALAVDNSVRNPGRAAATANALLIGVMLITLMTVGAASGQRTVIDAIDRQYPTDVQVTTSTGQISAALVSAVAAAPMVEQAAVVDTARIPVSVQGGRRDTAVILGPADDAGAAVHDARLLAGLAPGVLLTAPDNALGITDGATVTLGTGASAVRLRALVTADGPQGIVTRQADLAPARGAIPAADQGSTIWATLRPGTEPSVALDELNAVVAPLGASADGPAAQRAQLQQMIDIVLWVVVGLLAVAVVIALVGVGNTLSLSVLERTQESGLLRALGLTRSQLRRMFGLEALLLAAVAVVLGVILGIGYGIAGTHALLGGDFTVRIEIPWGRLLLVAAVAVAAGWLAAVLPARRGSRVPPAAALATE